MRIEFQPFRHGYKETEAHPTDLNDRRWALIEPLLPDALSILRRSTSVLHDARGNEVLEHASIKLQKRGNTRMIFLDNRRTCNHRC